MEILQLKDIARYLPYSLKCNAMGQYDEEDEDHPIGYVFICAGTYTDSDKDRYIEAWRNGEKCEIAFPEDFFPLLRPMADLIKPITVDGFNEGKEFVPLEVLSYTLFGSVGLIIDQKMCFGYRNRDTFYWDENDFTINYHDSDDYINVSFLKAYELLNQWHFDYNQLIIRRLAIDINTIKIK